MNNVNNTILHLLYVPLEHDYKHTLYFQTEEDQEAYFLSRINRTFYEFSYQRKDKPIRLPTVDGNGLPSFYENLIASGCNYVMYKNQYYGDKWIYAFITDIKYVNDGMVDIEIETDVMQTWAFDYSIKPSFVEREHVSDDTIGLHTLPEGLETGEYVCVERQDVDMGDTYIIVATTQSGESKLSGGLYGGTYSGVTYLAWKLLEYQKVNEFLEELAENRASDGISAIFLAPSFMIENNINVSNNMINGSNVAIERRIEVEKNHKIIGDYSPINKKLYTYPFNYLLLSNNNGGNVIYRYEDFEDEEMLYGTSYFKMYGVVTPGCSIKMVPLDYKGVIENIEEGLNGGKFPICNWATDVYTNWLTQNSVNIGLSMVSGGMQVLGGAGMMLTGAGAIAGASSMASGGLSIAQTLAQIHQQSMIPPQAEGNINSGDVLTAMKNNTFTFYKMSIKGEYAQIIDNYFDMYGYKINRVKIPNKNHRQFYWYTKTIDINIDGNTMPIMDLQKIKDVYNNGVTFWKSAELIQEYRIPNIINITEDSVTDNG